MKTHQVLNLEKELIMKTAMLRRTAPHEFDEWVAVLQQYSSDVARQCVQAPPDHLHRIQGRAQQCEDLTTLFVNACKTADRVEERAKSRRDFSAAV